MKKVLVFVLTIALVSTLSAAMGCGNKAKSSAGATVTGTSPATVTTHTGK